MKTVPQSAALKKSTMAAGFLSIAESLMEAISQVLIKSQLGIATWLKR